jgi:hypothetical protein
MVKSKETIKLEQQILYNLVQVTDMFPQYTIAQHILHILRTKGKNKDPYFWDDVTLLSIIEEYLDELHTDLATKNDDEYDY